jgi:hypothetical protein
MSESLGATYSPGRTIRFRVHDAQLGSGSSWSLVTKLGTNDVYVTHRESGSFIHCSFHHSGVSQYTLTDTALSDNSGEFARHLLESSQKEFVAVNLHHAHQIIVPYSELSTTYVEKVKARSFIDIPLHRESDAVNLNLYLADGPFGLIKMDQALLVAEMELGGGGSALLVAQPTRYENSIHDTFKHLIGEVRDSLKEKGLRNQETRFVMMVTDDESPGTKVEIEISLQLD